MGAAAPSGKVVPNWSCDLFDFYHIQGTSYPITADCGCNRSRTRYHLKCNKRINANYAAEGSQAVARFASIDRLFVFSLSIPLRCCSVVLLARNIQRPQEHVWSLVAHAALGSMKRKQKREENTCAHPPQGIDLRSDSFCHRSHRGDSHHPPSPSGLRLSWIMGYGCCCIRRIVVAVVAHQGADHCW